MKLAKAHLGDSNAGPLQMAALTSQDFKNILNIVTMINTCQDKDVFRRRVLDSFLKIFQMENSIFFLMDENSKLTDFFGRNIEEKYLRDFKNYYYKYDPFKLIQGHFRGNRIISLQDLVPYSSFVHSEYYNDFLRPQKIHYKTCVYLKSGIELLGIIGLFRPKEFGNFSEKEIRVIRTLGPHLSQALENIRIFKRIQFENSILNMVDRNLSSGIIILDDSLGMIHMNKKAKDFFKSLTGYMTEPKTNNHGKYHPFIHFMTGDCYRLREQMKNYSNVIPLPIHKIFKSPDSTKYSVCSQIIPKEMGPEDKFFYMIRIDELISQVNLDVEALENDFFLTKREIEILINIFKGLKNAEIAERLFISEITVKKHLQHIFEKMGIDSRTALIRKMVEYQCTEPPGQRQS